MSDNHRLSANAYRITKLGIEPPGPDGEMVNVELDGCVWIRISRTELRDLELFRFSVEKQTELSVPRLHGDGDAKSRLWHAQMNDLLFQSDHVN
jgi:hypothetical protein